MDLVWLEAVMIVALGVLWTQRKKAARAEVNRWLLCIIWSVAASRRGLRRVQRVAG